MLSKEQAQLYLNKLAISTTDVEGIAPVATSIKVLLGGTNTSVYKINIEGDPAGDVIRVNLDENSFERSKEVHEMEYFTSLTTQGKVAIPAPKLFEGDLPYLITETAKGEPVFIALQPYLGEPDKYDFKNMETKNPDDAKLFGISVAAWIEYVNYNPQNPERPGFEEYYEKKYDIPNFRFENPYPTNKWTEITNNSLLLLMEHDGSDYYKKLNNDFRNVASKAIENEEEAGKYLPEKIINWDQCPDNSKKTPESSCQIAFDNGEAGRGIEHIDYTMAMMFGCMDIKDGKCKLNMESAKAFLEGVEIIRGKKFTEKEAELMFGEVAELAVARWSTRRLEHHANLLNESLGKIRSSEPKFTYEQAIEEFKGQRETVKRGFDDLHGALKEFTRLRITGEYKKLFNAEKLMLLTSGNENEIAR